MRIPGGLPVRSVIFDAGIGAATLALALVLVLAPGAAASQPGTQPVDALGYTMAVLACLAVTGRWVAPPPVVGAVLGALIVFAVRDYPGGPLLIPVMVALYSVGTATVRLAVTCDGDVVAVEVVNDGTRPAAGGDGVGGNGITGMRERVAALGAVLEAGIRADGFRVTARVPVRAGEP